MKIPKVVGSSQSASGPMMGQTVPVMKPKMATTQPSRSGFKAQGSLVGHVAAVKGGGKPAELKMNNSSMKRPNQSAAPSNSFGYARHDYQPKKRI